MAAPYSDRANHQSQNGGNELHAGESLRGQSLTSESGRFVLRHTVDETRLHDLDGRVLWKTTPENIYGQSVFSLGLDGELRVWNHHRQFGWSSGTAGLGAEVLQVTDDGDLVLLDHDATVVWSSNSAPDSVPESVPEPLPARPPGRGARMRRGESLFHGSLPLTSEDGSTELAVNAYGYVVLTGGPLICQGRRPDDVLSLDHDGMLRVRSGGEVVAEIAGPGDELVVLPGKAQLLGGDGTVVWSVANNPKTRPPIWKSPVYRRQEALQLCFDSLSPGNGYTAAVALRTEPGLALQACGVERETVTTSTWQQLLGRAARTGTVAVAAVAVGEDCLVFAGRPDLDLTKLSVGTMVVSESRQPGEYPPSDWIMQIDGKEVTHFRGQQPKRRKGLKRPEIVQAVQQINDEGFEWSEAAWLAEFFGLALMCQVAGVQITAADLRGPLLGGVWSVFGLLPATVLADPETPSPPRAALEPGQGVMVVRTDYTDDTAWAQLLEELKHEDFESTEILGVDDATWAGASPDDVLAALPVNHDLPIVVLADHETMIRASHDVLVVSCTEPLPSEDYEPPPGVTRELRCEPSEVVSMYVNLDIANMSWEGYCDGG